jgi:hypothetical protein
VPSSLLALPWEIRNTIITFFLADLVVPFDYTISFVPFFGIHRYFHFHRIWFEFSTGGSYGRRPYLALAMHCRQLQADVLPLVLLDVPSSIVNKAIPLENVRYPNHGLWHTYFFQVQCLSIDSDVFPPFYDKLDVLNQLPALRTIRTWHDIYNGLVLRSI